MKAPQKSNRTVVNLNKQVAPNPDTYLQGSRNLQTVIMNSQSSLKIEQAPIFENTLKIDLRKESPENNSNEEDSEAKKAVGYSLNPALNRRIKQPKKIADPRKQVVLKVKKSLGQMTNPVQQQKRP